jgi:hypothetical protein
VTCGTRGHFGNELRPTDDRAVGIQLYLTTASRLNEQTNIWLRLVVQIEPEGGDVTAFDTGGEGAIVPEHGNEIEVGATVRLLTDRRGHMDDSVDEFPLLEVGHGMITPIKFFAREPIARTQRRNGSHG